MSESGAERPVRSAAFIFIFLTVLLDMLALGIVMPVLPRLVLAFLGNDTARASTVVGVFGTVWALMQFLSSPVIGAVSDRFGRRPIILLSNLGLGLDYVLMALAPGIVLLFVGRVISGITAASVSTAGAYIADAVPSEKRAGAFGMLSVAFGIGFVAGPALGGVLGDIDPRLPFWCAAGLSLCNAAYGFFVLPESLVPERRAPFQWRRANPVGSLRLLRSHPELYGLAAVNFIEMVAHYSLTGVFVLYAGYRYGWDAKAVGLAISAVGVTSALVGGVIVRPAVARFGERACLIVGLLFGMAGFLLFGLASTGIWFLVGIPVMGLWGLTGPALQGLMTRRVGVDEQGQLQGAIASIQAIAGLIGPFLFSVTFAFFISGAGVLQIPGAPYLLAALLMAVAAGAALRITRRGSAL
jgi:DHA1 family tetracycline resistance protein-like MFS transporter